ncbi:MAG: hypothetical protein ACRERZ_00720 [Gammaproteobacteria bacterium]
MSKIIAWLSQTGENPAFIAFNAHCWFACSVILATKGNPWVAGIGIVVAGLKEFWFDMRYETTPPQTFGDSLEDFSGYMIGLVIALLVAHFTGA